MIEWKLSSDGMEWTAGADDLYLSVFDTGDRIMWDVGVSMRRRSTSEGKAASFDEGKAKAETFAREWVARQAAALNPDWSSEPVASFEIPSPWIPVGERLPEDEVEVLVYSCRRSPARRRGGGMTLQSENHRQCMWAGCSEPAAWAIRDGFFSTAACDKHRDQMTPAARDAQDPLPPLPVAEVEG